MVRSIQLIQLYLFYPVIPLMFFKPISYTFNLLQPLFSIIDTLFPFYSFVEKPPNLTYKEIMPYLKLIEGEGGRELTLTNNLFGNDIEILVLVLFYSIILVNSYEVI